MTSGAATAPLNLVFQALADPTRRLLLERLTLGPASVSELARPSPCRCPPSSSTSSCWRPAAWCAPKKSAACAPATSRPRPCAPPSAGSASGAPPGSAASTAWASYWPARPNHPNHHPTGASQVTTATFCHPRHLRHRAHLCCLAGARLPGLCRSGPQAALVRRRRQPAHQHELDFRVGGHEISPRRTRRRARLHLPSDLPGDRPRPAHRQHVRDGHERHPHLGVGRHRREAPTPKAAPTRLVYRAGRAFSNGLDTPAQREDGTRELLDNLDTVLLWTAA